MAGAGSTAPDSRAAGPPSPASTPRRAARSGRGSPVHLGGFDDQEGSEEEE